MSQEITSAQATVLLTNEFVGASAPIFYAEIDGKTNIKIMSFSTSREYGANAPGGIITIANVNPSDPRDTGYYNQQRHGDIVEQPANEFEGIIQPAKVVTVSVGYGDNAATDTVDVFTGSIDTVRVNIDGAGNSTMVLNCRGLSKKLVDTPIQCKRVVSGTIFYHMNYPVNGWAASGEELVEYYLEQADTNPLLLEIWIDVCMRAGYEIGELNFDTSWTTRVNDCADGSFTNCTGTWIELARKVVDLLGAYMWEDELGELHLRVANNQVYSGDDTFTLNGTAWTELEDGGYARAIEETISVTNWMSTNYTSADWDFDYATNSIRRSSGSNIGDGEEVIVTYTYCAWLFRSNQIYNLTQWTSHDEMFGRLVATNNELNLERTTTLDALGDGSALSTLKAIIEDKPELHTNALLDAYLVTRRAEMRKEYFNISFSCVAVPQLRVRDLIVPFIWGTVKAIYEITGFTISYDAVTGMSMNIEAIYYGASSIT